MTINFRFPLHDKDLTKRWAEIINYRYIPTEWNVICSMHFPISAFVYNQKKKCIELKSGSCPIVPKEVSKFFFTFFSFNFNFCNALCF